MNFSPRQRRTLEFQELYPVFKEVIDRTRQLNPLLAVLLDTVEDYWNHSEIELAAETLLDYLIADDRLRVEYHIGVELEDGARLEMLISDVVQTFLVLDYTGSKRYAWQNMETLFYH